MRDPATGWNQEQYEQDLTLFSTFLLKIGTLSERFGVTPAPGTDSAEQAKAIYDIISSYSVDELMHLYAFADLVERTVPGIKVMTLMWLQLAAVAPPQEEQE